MREVEENVEREEERERERERGREGGRGGESVLMGKLGRVKPASPSDALVF